MRFKISKLLVLTICLVFLSVFACAAVSCKKNNETSAGAESSSVAESNSETNDNESQSPSSADETEYVYIISGATDSYVNLGAVKASIDCSSVKARRENGDAKTYPVEVDDSAVTWGTKGVYTVKYVCGNSFVEKKIYIYDKTLPTIDGASNKTVASSGEILSGITATDQFGFSLSVTYFVNGVEKGNLAAGDNEVEIQAADPVGNVKKVTIKVTLK